MDESGVLTVNRANYAHEQALRQLLLSRRIMMAGRGKSLAFGAVPREFRQQTVHATPAEKGRKRSLVGMALTRFLFASVDTRGKANSLLYLT